MFFFFARIQRPKFHFLLLECSSSSILSHSFLLCFAVWPSGVFTCTNFYLVVRGPLDRSQSTTKVNSAACVSGGKNIRNHSARDVKKCKSTTYLIFHDDVNCLSEQRARGTRRRVVCQKRLCVLKYPLGRRRLRDHVARVGKHRKHKSLTSKHVFHT